MEKTTTEQEQITLGYKGFDKDFKCLNMQYKVGETATSKGELEVCANGLHFCTNPFHVLRYYSAANKSRYAKVKGIGEAKTHKDDSKVAVSKLHVECEISIHALVKAGLKFVFDRIKKEKPAQTASGNYSTGAASGDSSTGAASGYSSTAKVTGKNSIAIAWGRESKASGIKGCFIVLNEWKEVKGEWTPTVKVFKVDGNKIKENTFYKLKDGKAVEV